MLYNSTDCMDLHSPARLPWGSIQILRHNPKQSASSLSELCAPLKSEFGFLFSILAVTVLST